VIRSNRKDIRSRGRSLRQSQHNHGVAGDIPRNPT
jgi:hypothetical protein